MSLYAGASVSGGGNVGMKKCEIHPLQITSILLGKDVQKALPVRLKRQELRLRSSFSQNKMMFLTFRQSTMEIKSQKHRLHIRIGQFPTWRGNESRKSFLL